MKSLAKAQPKQDLGVADATIYYATLGENT